MSSGQERKLKDGDVLFREGDRGDHAYLIRDGEIEIIKNIDTSAETVLETVGRGELIGEMAVLEDRPRVASARVKGGATITTLDRVSFLSRATRDPHVALRVMKTLSDRLRSAKIADRSASETSQKNIEGFMEANQNMAVNEGAFRQKTMLASFILSAVILMMLIGTMLVEVETTVSAYAKVVPSTPNLTIEAETEGFLKEVLIKAGDDVKAGQVIARLDSSAIEAEIRSLSAELSAAKNRLERQEKERTFLQEGADLSVLSGQITDNVLLARLTRRESRILVFDQDIAATEASLRHKQSEKEVLEIEYNVAKEQAEMMNAGRVSSGAISKMDSLSSKILLAQAERKVLEKEAEITALQGRLEKIKAEKHSFVTEWNAEIETRIEEDKALVPALQAKLERLQVEKGVHTVRSPIDGKVLELLARREGTVLQQGHPVAVLTRTGQELIIEAEVTPKDVEALKEGLQVSFKLDALPFQRYGDLSGTIIRVDEDATPSHRPNVNDEFFMVHIRLAQKMPRAAPKDFALRRGMTGRADMITGKRTIASYLLDPLMGSVQTAFREAS